jgi:hypothetical protein
VKAKDLPIGTVVRRSDGRTFTRDQAGSMGWQGPPVGFYMNHEIDQWIADGATVELPGTGGTADGR